MIAIRTLDKYVFVSRIRSFTCADLDGISAQHTENTVSVTLLLGSTLILPYIIIEVGAGETN